MSWYSYKPFIGTSRKKNILKFAYLRKAILFLESETDLLKLPLPPINKPIIPHKSKVYFIPDPKRLGIDSMGEFATAFELSGQFLGENGAPAPYIHIAEALELAFNFTFGGAYKSKARVFSRKPFNLTKALDSLKNLLIRETRNRDEKRDEK